MQFRHLKQLAQKAWSPVKMARSSILFPQWLQLYVQLLHIREPYGLPYSAWQLLEHLRIAQHDILNFSAPPTGGYHPLQWPEDYWPKVAEPPSSSAWDSAVAAIGADREAFEGLIARPEADLTKPFRWGDGQNLLREALLISDHTAYHVGELIVLRRVLGIWHS